MFGRSLWIELGRLLTGVARAGAEGALVFNTGEDEFLEKVFWESRLTRYLWFPCSDPPVRRFLERYLKRRLLAHEAEQFSEHLFACDRCREEVMARQLAAKLMQELRRHQAKRRESAAPEP